MSEQHDHVQGLKALRDALGGDDLAKQVYADANAADRATRRDAFEARLEYVKQKSQIGQAAESALKEYGLQTLKWLFLLNAGAIGLVLAYVAGKFPDAKASPSVLKATWPFAAGCVSVVAAGAFAFFNFSYGAGSIPSAEALNKFLNPSVMEWPLGKMQTPGETGLDFHDRYVRKIGTTRKIAIGLAATSAALFVVGIVSVLATI